MAVYIVVPKRKMLRIQEETVQPEPFGPITDISGFLRNLVEDITPQLGAHLDTQGYNIESGDFKILLGTDKIWFLTPSMVFELKPTSAKLQVPLDMNAEKIIGLAAPTANNDAARKAYVDARIGGLNNIVEDTTPQLGGNLDTNMKNIGSGNFKVLFDSDNNRIWFLTPSMVFQLTPTGAKLQVPLNMNSEKITGLAAPTNNNDAARKAYVDGFTTAAIVFIIDGGGSAITTGEKGHLRLPFAGAIISANLIADQSGSIVIDIWKDNITNPLPDNDDSITASAPPTLSSEQVSLDTTLTGWTKTFGAGDILAFNVDSVTDIERVTLTLVVEKT